MRSFASVESRTRAIFSPLPSQPLVSFVNFVFCVSLIKRTVAHHFFHLFAPTPLPHVSCRKLVWILGHRKKDLSLHLIHLPSHPLTQPASSFSLSFQTDHRPKHNVRKRRILQHFALKEKVCFIPLHPSLLHLTTTPFWYPLHHLQKKRKQLFMFNSNNLFSSLLVSFL